MTRDEVLAIIKQAEEERWEELDLSGRGLKELPEGLAELTYLQSLNIGWNNLGTLPEGLAQLTNLQSLYLGGNNLGTLPEWLAQLSNLHTLYLSYNNLGTLPEWLAQLSNLQSLYISNNNLGTLPEWLAQLSNLQSLDISWNNLGTLPEWLAQLSNLQSLYISNNNLGTLPEWLAQLSNLQSLDISWNNLGTLPEWLAQLPQLQQLYINENPIAEPSPEVLGDALTRYKSIDLEAIRRYYIQLREAGEETFYEAKLLIVGEGGVGKTSLARKLQEPLQPLKPGEESTTGIDVIEWAFDLPADYDKERYHVNIWDFGGQAIYSATHQFFLTKRSVYVLVADTRREPAGFYDWLRMQEAFGGDSPILLLKNRNRKEGNRFYIENLPQIQERFTNLKEIFEIDLNEAPKEKEWPWLVQSLQDYFLNLEHIGQPRPKTWVNVRQALSEDERDTISQTQFIQLCKAQGVKRDADALQLSDYLHHLGDILHFQDDPILRDIVILKPTWGLDAVYRVLDDPKIVENWGQFSLHDLRRLWHEPHYAGHHLHLLRLMENFQICYPLPDQKDTYIAPQLLHEKGAGYAWEQADNLQLRYQYPVFMPRGILSRAIVKLHKRIEDQALVWRSGVILNDGYARAELLEMRGENEIRIRVSGRNMRDLLMEIVRALEELHQGFPKLNYQKLIPCNCQTCALLADPHFFQLDDLRERLAHGRSTIECNKPPFAQVSIHSLLDDSLLHISDRGGQNVLQQFFYGDVVGGDKVGGDVFRDVGVSGVEGSAVSIGGKGRAAVDKGGSEGGAVNSKQ